MSHRMFARITPSYCGNYQIHDTVSCLLEFQPHCFLGISWRLKFEVVVYGDCLPPQIKVGDCQDDNTNPEFPASEENSKIK